jgi:hypothetical protein
MQKDGIICIVAVMDTMQWLSALVISLTKHIFIGKVEPSSRFSNYKDLESTPKEVIIGSANSASL